MTHKILIPGIEALRPPPERTPDQWADQCRILPSSEAEPGPWRSDRTPYMTPIMRACNDPKYRRVVTVTASQSGKTEALINYLGFRLDDDPTPILFVSPTQKLVESVSNNRVMGMFRTTPSLWDKLDKARSSNKMTEKYIAGVRVGFGWAGSATELSSHPCGIVLVDERDRMDADVAGEGDPVELAEARTATYPGGKTIVCSTPTIEGASPIWKLWEEGTRAEFCWPCPHCGGYFAPKMALLRWPEGATPAQVQRLAWVECPKCGGKIEEKHKKSMNLDGVFVCPGQEMVDGHLVGDPPDTDCASFWVSGLTSPWRTFGDRAKALVMARASGEPGRIQAVVNTGFGELFRQQGEAPDWRVVADLRRDYRFGEIPAGGQVLTMGVDVRKRALHYVIRAWGHKMESWLVDAQELIGDTTQPHIWSALSDVIAAGVDGRPISRVLIDSGYKPGTAQTRRTHADAASRASMNPIYAFCKAHKAVAFPTKGHQALDRPYKSTTVEVTPFGKTAKNSVQLWHIDTDFSKSWVHSRVTWPAGEPGGWWIPSDTPDEYCRQIVNEARVIQPGGRAVWVENGANHFLDCESLAFVAAKMLRLDNLPDPSSKQGAATVRRKTHGGVE